MVYYFSVTFGYIVQGGRREETRPGAHTAGAGAERAGAITGPALAGEDTNTGTR